MDPTLQDETKPSDARWRFFRDVVVFELKMFIGNLRDFALMPVSLVAAIIDLVSKGDREGSLFYRVLRWGANSDQMLDAYSPVRHELHDRNINPDYTVDAVVARLENMLVREIEKGGDGRDHQSSARPHDRSVASRNESTSRAGRNSSGEGARRREAVG